MREFNENNILILFDGASGIYIPKRFANEMDRGHVSGVTDEDWEDLEAGPESEQYWDTWDQVLNNAVLIDNNGQTYHLYQDDDVFAIPDDMEMPPEWWQSI